MVYVVAFVYFILTLTFHRFSYEFASLVANDENIYYVYFLCLLFLSLPLIISFDISYTTDKEHFTNTSF